MCDLRELRHKEYRVRMTIGGDKLEYTSDISSPATFMLKIKLLVNSIISDEKMRARFLTADLKDFVLQTIMIERKFVRIKAKNVPEYTQ